MSCEHDQCARYGQCLESASPELQARALHDLFAELGATGAMCGRPYHRGEDITDMVHEAGELCAVGDWEGAGAVYAARLGAVMLEPEWFEEHGAFLLGELLPRPRSGDDVLAFRRGVERRCQAN